MSPDEEKPTMESRGAFTTGTWNSAGEATLEATAGSIDDVFATALTALSRLAGGESGEGEMGPEQEASISVPIRGQGRDYGSLFTELAGDLLAQLDANGTGLARVRLDGLLETDTGYTAWGYALGTTGGPKPVLGLNVIDSPTLSRADTRTTLSVRLRKSS